MRDHRHSAAAGAGASHSDGLSTPGKSTLAEPHAVAASAGGAGHALHGGVNGGAQNVDLTSINHHQGFDANRLGTAGHHNFKTIHATPLYKLDGTPGDFVIPPGAECEINAGAITKLVLRNPGEAAQAPDKHGHAVECVFIFNVLGHGGWMPTSALPPKVLHEQLGIAKAISRERGDAHHHFGRGTKILTGVSAESEGVAGLYTYPRQTGVQNKAKYYFNNLALNLPFTGGARVGVLTTNLAPDHSDPQSPDHADFHGLDPYREFHAEQPHRKASIPLYTKGASRPSGKSLHFVYGYVVNDAGGRVYGWINKSLLAKGFEPRHGI